MPAEAAGGFGAISAAFADHSFEEGFLESFKLPRVRRRAGAGRIRMPPDVFREVFGQNVRSRSHGNGPLDGVFKLTDISRPAVCGKQWMGLGADSHHFRIWSVAQVPVFSDKVGRKTWNVLRTSGERRQLQWKDI